MALTVAFDGIFTLIPLILYTRLGILGNFSALNLKAAWAVFGYAFCLSIISVNDEKTVPFCKVVTLLSAVSLITLTVIGKLNPDGIFI